MADYKRLVSYIYNYDAGMRQKNVGFSRVESKNGQCKVTIHITTSLSTQDSLKVYLFRRTGSQMEGIYFGDMSIKNGTGDFKAETNTYSLMDSPYSLEDISGVLLMLNKGKFFCSQWDDEPIMINDFVVFDAKKREEERVDRLLKDIHVEPQDVHEMMMEEELANRVNESDEESVLQVAGLFQKEEVEEPQQLFRDEEESQESTEPQESAEQEADAQWSPNKEVETEGVKSASVEEEEQEAEPDPNPNNRIEWTMEETASVREEETETGEDEVKLQAESVGSSCCCSDNYPDCVRQILKSFPSVKPFPNSRPDLWVRIEPKDIGMFPVETWILANNSFLLHGYYNYRHLVFGILEIGKTPQYVIGVPGVLQSTEQAMAGMFGFHRFVSANSKDAEQGSFGYWIQQIVL